MNVINLMSLKSQVTYVKASVSVPMALGIMRNSGFSAIAVLEDDGSYVGIATERDFLYSMVDGTAVDEEGHPKRVGDIADRVEAVTIDCDTMDVVTRAINEEFVPVVDGRGMFMGLVTRKKVINYLIHEQGL